MKKLLLLSALLIFACSTDSEGNPCIYEPTLTTEAATDITETSATLNGVISIVSENCDVPNNTEQGFVYSTEIQPTLEDIQVNVNGTNISTTIDGLVPNTTYYVRAFLTNNFGDFYGDEVSFTTIAGQVVLNTTEVTNITFNSAFSGGEILSDGNTTIASKGVCYGTSSNPTIDDYLVSDISSNTMFSSSIQGLNSNTQYYVRAYATNEFDTYYGNEVSFITDCVFPDTLVSQELTRVDGNISIDFYYDAVNPDGYSIDNVILNYSFNSENVSIEVGNNSQDVINIQNLLPLTQYYNVELEFISSECGNITYSYNDFDTPALYEVGDVGLGGVIIYMYPNGANGIVASEIDAGLAQWACDTSNNVFWDSYETFVNNLNDWEGQIGDGEQSSAAIMDFLVNGTGNSDDGYFGNFCGLICSENLKAVELCYEFEHNGYDDWYLPHIKTLDLIYDFKANGLLTNFQQSGCGTSGMIYASSCGDAGNAGIIDMQNGDVSRGSFGAVFSVRPVRKF
mgnify:CR=1 FL=1|tara:strand:- start:433 stop:1965 length:1533 start_codon:yes stop_codon:yes gene_type:complete